ncbi:MAG TPA: hypothetical protein DCM27_02135 [Rhodospirillaceae bacterium]|nr:hypothetical protein [Rhodospirillaceae bacterium]
MNVFNYYEAFDRNIGWITAQELEVLKTKRIAIAGLGGVGGYHLLTLLRLGFTRFHLAEMDVVELANFNRQACAGVSKIGRAKIDVMRELAHDINPDAELTLFAEGVNDENLDAFLDGVDLYVDGLDFFVLDIRQKIFRLCYQKNIPAMTTAPLGMGAAHLNFLPNHMSFDEYFALDGVTGDDRFIKFLIGLSPSMLQKGYLVDMTRVNFAARKGPSTPMACEICAGIVGTEAIKILLGRGDVRAAPKGFHFDAYKNTLKRTWRPLGNRHPLQRILFQVIKQIIKKNSQ